MSLTSYRAAPPRGERVVWGVCGGGERVWLVWGVFRATGRPGDDRLSHVLRRSTIGAEGFHGRVRDGIGCRPLAMATRSSGRTGGFGPCQPGVSRRRSPGSVSRWGWGPCGRGCSDRWGIAGGGALGLGGLWLWGALWRLGLRARWGAVCRSEVGSVADRADRAISTGKLRTLLHVHTRPIDVVVCHGSDGEAWF